MTSQQDEMTADRVAVLVPGAAYPAEAPLLFYAGLALARRDVEIRRVSWPRPIADDVEEVASMVRNEVTLALGDSRAVVVAKSLGTLAAGLVAERRLPALWLTPLLDEPAVVEAIAAAAMPSLMVGGTADPMWNGALARRLSPHVLEIEGADHALHVPGPVSASVAVAGQVADAVEAFLDEHVWPGRPDTPAAG